MLAILSTIVSSQTLFTLAIPSTIASDPVTLAILSTIHQCNQRKQRKFRQDPATLLSFRITVKTSFSCPFFWRPGDRIEFPNHRKTLSFSCPFFWRPGDRVEFPNHRKNVVFFLSIFLATRRLCWVSESPLKRCLFLVHFFDDLATVLSFRITVKTSFFGDPGHVGLTLNDQRFLAPFFRFALRPFARNISSFKKPRLSQIVQIQSNLQKSIA